MTLYYLQYANYFNRIVKRKELVTDYTSDPACNTVDIVSGVNFVPNDGISATQVWNTGVSTLTPDYVLVVDEDSLIVSRWYVIKSARLRGGQYQLELMRDVIADWYDSVISSPIFIRKATLNAGNPLIFNSENMTYNQIKVKETQIKDITGIPWIVGYIDRDLVLDSVKIGVPDIGSDYEVNSLADYKYYAYSNSPMKTELGRIYRYNFYDGGGIVPSNTSYCFAWNDYGGALAPTDPNPTTGEYFAAYTFKKTDGTKKIGYRTNESPSYYGNVGLGKVQPYVKSQDWFSIKTKDYLSNIEPSITISRLELESGKIIRVGSDPTTATYYRINVEKLPQSTSIVTINPSSGLGLMMSGLTDTFNSVGFLASNNPYTDPRFELEVQHTNTQITFTEVYNGQLSITLPADRPHTLNTPYDIFCIPYGEIKVGSSTQPVSTSVSLQMASQISKQGGGQTAGVYDIQLLPFCPLSRSRFNVSADRLTLRPGDQFVYHPNEPNKIYSALCWVDEAEFSFTIDDPAYAISMPQTAVDIKIMNETQIFRLVSPNYNGMFEFSPAKNNGITAYDIDCAYKPYTPYIKIAPRFNGLYGKDFNDARGLICGGDFSLSQITDAWEKYQIENKNYDNIFKTQLETMDAKNKIQKNRDIITAATGTLQGATSGAMAGSFVGGGWGAAIGGVVGGIASGAAGAADVYFNQKNYQLDRKLTQDLYEYDLGNIQAMPASITKVSSFNPNNKIFPILEEYSATADEQQALRDKLTYNGMTVMTIGTIRQHLQEDYSFVQGDIIRMNNIDADHQIAVAIADELNKGVYIK